MSSSVRPIDADLALETLVDEVEALAARADEEQLRLQECAGEGPGHP
jgi:hypothetical protein